MHAPAAIGVARAMRVPVVASLNQGVDRQLRYRLGLRWHLFGAKGRGRGGCDLLLTADPDWIRGLPSCDVPIFRIWGHGVDRARFRPDRRDRAWRRSLGIADYEVAALVLGPPESAADVNILRSVVRLLNANRVPVRAIVVGDGRRCQRLARQLPNSICIDQLDDGELARVVASCDVLLNPGVTPASAAATLQAMSCGVPVVAADSPLGRALVVNGVSGLLVAGNLVETYAAAVRSLVGEANRRRAMASAGIARARAFEWTTILDEVLDAYHELVRGQVAGLHETPTFRLRTHNVTAPKTGFLTMTVRDASADG